MTGARTLDGKRTHVEAPVLRVVPGIQNVQSVPSAAGGGVTQPPAEVTAERKASASATTTAKAGGDTQVVGSIDKGVAVFSRPATR